MSHWIGTTSPADAGMSDFKECLKQLRDGHPEDALLHVRKALGIAPRNAFYLSYTGLLAALAERRFADAEMLCQEALGMRHNHAQLYLNLAEVYVQRRPNVTGRHRDARKRSFVFRGAGFSNSARFAKDRHAARTRLPDSCTEATLLNRALGRWRHRFTGTSRAA